MPVPATHWDSYGPVPTFVHRAGKKPKTLVVGNKFGSDLREVPSDSVKFKFGPDSEKFGIPFKDPYAGIDRNDDLRAEGVSLKSLARKLLREADEEVEKEPGEDSLDAQIDKYLASYEVEAKNSKNEGLNFRSLSSRFLFEAGEDEEDKEDEDSEEKEDSEDKEEKGEAEDAEEEKLTSEDIDVGNFTASVMRLVDNYDTLLEVRSAVLRRTVNFLSKNYDKDVVDSFKEELLDSYDVEIGKTDAERKDDEFEAPSADRAGSSPGGGG